MKVFDLNKMTALPYEQRERNVFYQTKEFKTRMIELPPGGEMPTCEMASHVIFYVLDGEVKVTINSETVELREKQCLITEPAIISMKTENGVRLMGIQVAKSPER
jgi:quercetin dioxygenase-like cupin family protein